MQAVTAPATLSAAAYLLYDLDANQVIFAENADLALPVASLTKLMTALLVLESGDLQSETTIQGSDLVGGTSMGLVPGEVVTVEDLLWGMLIPSGNDAVTALARHIGGSVPTFVDQMNARATTLGLRKTHFVNPHGLDAENHLSSANDLLILVKQNWDFPLFREIVGTAQTTVGRHQLQNTNELLDTYLGTNGIKTGTTDLAGQCLVAGFERNGHQVFAIVLGSTDRYQDMRALHQQYTVGYSWVTGETASISILDRLYTADGQRWYLRTSDLAPSLLLHAVEVSGCVPIAAWPFLQICLADGYASWRDGMASW
ncbi:MAG: D-alanyl-D-alanine carboxypeptidase family protein [Caldilineaceae bacterium]